MIELTAENTRDYLIREGRCGTAERLVVEPLTGGVSNAVLLVTPERDASWVLKQSRAQLRTEADWFSRLDRIVREAEAQRALQQLLPAGTVPAVLFEDRENYCYAMEALPMDHAVWKRQLLAGQVVPELFPLAGALLGAIHATSGGRPDFLSQPDDVVVFDELRVDPFYRRIAAVHPIIRRAVDDVIQEMTGQRLSLVHADFSPKNLLVIADGLALVDYETVHYGDPAFDLGFFFSHLWLKALALPAVRGELIQGIDAAWTAYRQRLAEKPRGGAIEAGSLSVRAVRHLAACLLARVDGKSPVDYLTVESHRELIRRLTLDWLPHPPVDFDVAFDRLSDELNSV